MSVELNIDGLVGPTHNYAGLSFGNIASSGNKGAASNPKAAALQGLQKMRTLVSMGLPQAVMPPHARPLTHYLRTLGFNGTDSIVHEKAWKANPSLVGNLMSASPMQQTKFPGRQTLEASKAVARLHQLDGASTLYLRQSAKAIDAGAFHNDVVCVTNGTVMFYHKDAFDDLTAMQEAVKAKAELLGFEPEFLMADIPIQDAIKSYLFNSQLLTLPNGKMGLILPKNAEDTPTAKAFIDHCIAGNNPIMEAHYLDLKQSMQNGGGPACLRLRVQLTNDELSQVHSPMLLDEAKITDLEHWVNKHYRDAVAREDLGDPALMMECRTALDDLTERLSLGSIYDFQMEGGVA